MTDTEHSRNQDTSRFNIAVVTYSFRHELRNCLNELKLLVLPSASDGLPGIVQEAMPCGLLFWPLL